jgi:hypothetical protein
MSKKTPQAPSPQATSAAQTGTNIATANANTYAMNGNITTDDGTRTTTFRNQDIYDPFTKETYKGVIPDVVETLSPAQKAIKDQQDQASLGLSTLANKQTGKMSGYLDKPFTFDDQAHTSWATDMYRKLNGQQFADEQDATRSRLSNMGIKMGNTAYDKELSRLEQSQGQQRDRFALDSYGQDFATQQALRNQPINEITALMSGGQVSQPVFNGASVSSIPTTDNASIISNTYANQVAAADKRNAGTGAILSGIGGLFSLSDERAKKDKRKIGELNGQEIYKYRMKSGGPMQMGMMAQKVEKKTPEAVMTGPDGLKRVNYPMAMAMGRRKAA